MKDLEKELKEQYRQLGDVLNQQEIVNNQIAKRYMNSRITMFWFDWVLYALVVAAIAFVIYAAFVQPDTLWIAFLAGFLVVSMTRLFGMTPKMVELTPEAVCIHLWVGKKTIDYDTIAKVERFTYKGNNIRLFLCSKTNDLQWLQGFDISLDSLNEFIGIGSTESDLFPRFHRQ